MRQLETEISQRIINLYNDRLGKSPSQIICHFFDIAFTNHMRYIIAPSSLAGRGLGVGFLYLTQPRTAILKS
ncbi:MAG: Na-translocating system protein MpsC family protein [Nostoc sp.]|uniref:Na-translocating system protein MpsC family protein n=1 Tax=Nostoc sp. TaxID=1180 RepID=UPI002FF4DA94